MYLKENGKKPAAPGMVVNVHEAFISLHIIVHVNISLGNEITSKSNRNTVAAVWIIYEMCMSI